MSVVGLKVLDVLKDIRYVATRSHKIEMKFS